jgi:hypothetical protein
MNWSTKPNHPGWYSIFVVPTMFPSGSHFVPIRFTMGSQHIYRIMSRERERERERDYNISYLVLSKA